MEGPEHYSRIVSDCLSVCLSHQRIKKNYGENVPLTLHVYNALSISIIYGKAIGHLFPGKSRRLSEAAEIFLNASLYLKSEHIF